MSIWDDISDIAEDVVNAAGSVVGNIVDAGASLFEGPGVLTGIVTAGGALFILGPSVGGNILVPAFIAGSAAGNALIRHRHMTDEERTFAEGVFGNTLPPNDRIVLTNLLGLEGRKFVMPNVNGEILVNLGDACYDDPIRYQDDKYPAPGKLLIHELTHVWQIHHASFVPGLVCESIVEQLRGSDYEPGSGGKNWSEYNAEQQATLVDEWYAPSFRGPGGWLGTDNWLAQRPEHPFFRYVKDDIGGAWLTHVVNNGAATYYPLNQQLEVARVRPDGGAWLHWKAQNGPWAPAPAPISPPGLFPPGAAVTAVYYPLNQQLEAFAVGNNGQMCIMWKAQNGPWAPAPAPISPPGLFPPGASVVAAYYPLNEQLEAFAVGNNGQMCIMWKAQNGPWAPAPAPISPPGLFPPGASVVAAYYPLNEQLEVLAVGNDGRVYLTWKANNGPWAPVPVPISPLGFAPPGGALACSLYPAYAQLEVFVAGNDGAVSVLWKQSNGSWQGPAGITASGFTRPGASITAISYPIGNQLEVLVAGPDDAINLLWKRNNEAWTPSPVQLTGPGALGAGSRLSSVFYPLNRQLEAFFVGPDGKVRVVWKANNAAWAPPGAIE